MADYIFCTRKKNNPRIDVRICEKKCPYKNECQEYSAYKQRKDDQASILNSKIIVPPLVHAAASKQ